MHVVDDVGDVVVVAGFDLSATNVPGIAASKRFSVAVSVGADSRATTDVPAAHCSPLPRTNGFVERMNRTCPTIASG